MVSTQNKSPCVIKDLETENEDNFSKKFIPKNYSVPMEYKDRKLVYIYR